MSVTNTSASLTTYRRRQLALYGWRQADNYSGGAPVTNKQEQAPSYGYQAAGPMAGVPLNAYIGAQLAGQTNGGVCGCSSSTTLQGYVKQAPALCSNVNP
jgi:hypothetical protein